MLHITNLSVMDSFPASFPRFHDSGNRYDANTSCEKMHEVKIRGEPYIVTEESDVSAFVHLSCIDSHSLVCSAAQPPHGEVSFFVRLLSKFCHRCVLCHLCHLCDRSERRWLPLLPFIAAGGCGHYVQAPKGSRQSGLIVPNRPICFCLSCS